MSKVLNASCVAAPAIEAVPGSARRGRAPGGSMPTPGVASARGDRVPHGARFTPHAGITRRASSAADRRSRAARPHAHRGDP
jgi:hypothetical protein